MPGAVGSGGGSSTTFLIASIERPIEGFFSGADQTAAATQLPGLSTRAISAAAFGISGKKHQAEAACDGIERVRVKWKSSHVTRAERHVCEAQRRRLASCDGEHLLGEIQSDHASIRSNGLCTEQGGIAGARTEIEDAHAESKPGIGHEPVIQKRHLLVEESIPLLPAPGDAVPVLPLAFDDLFGCLLRHVFPFHPASPRQAHRDVPA